MEEFTRSLYSVLSKEGDYVCILANNSNLSGTLTPLYVNTVLCNYHEMYSIDTIQSQVYCKLLYIFAFNSTMLSWLISCTLNFSLCMANPVCITNECIMYTNYRYRLYTRYTFYCCSSRDLFSFSQLEVRLLKACLIVWKMPHSFKNLLSPGIYLVVPLSLSSVINITWGTALIH